MNEIIVNFISERKLLEIPRVNIVDQSSWFEPKGGVVKFLPYVTPVADYDPVLGTVPIQHEQGRKAVSHKDLVNFVEDINLMNNDDAVYTVPVGEQKKIVQMIADVNAVGAAARVMTVTVAKSMGLVAALGDAMVTGGVNLAAGEFGIISMYQSGPTWLNTNGAIADEDTNITGIVLQAGDTITVTWTNKQANDRGRLSVGEIDLPVI